MTTHSLMNKNRYRLRKRHSTINAIRYATWQILRSAINKTNDKFNLPQTSNINGKNVTDEFQIAESFSEFYVGKGASKNVPKSNKHFTDYLKINQSDSKFLEPVDECKIIEIISNLKPKMSLGHDEIPTKIMKQSILRITQPLIYIIKKLYLTQ